MTKALMVGAREKDSFDFGGLSIRWKVDWLEMRYESVADLYQRLRLTFPSL